MSVFTLKYTFQVGDVISSDKMNTNFSDIATKVNGNLDGNNISRSADLTVANVTVPTISTPDLSGGSHNIVYKLPDHDGSHSFYLKDSSGNTLLTVSSDGNVSYGTKYINKFLAVGSILMYNGTGWEDNSTIKGWYKCDGNNGTVNLLNKFIRCEATSGNTGGSNDIKLIQHTHTNSCGNDDTAHSHTIGIGGWTGYTNPNHTHTIYLGVTAGSEFTLKYAKDESPSGLYTNSIIYSHYHTYSGTLPNTSTRHTHTSSISNTGQSATNRNMPPYYSLIFIQRIS